jgi:hypothetical protein
MRPSQEGMRPVIRLFLILTKVVAVRDPSQQGMEPDRARETIPAAAGQIRQPP